MKKALSLMVMTVVLISIVTGCGRSGNFKSTSTPGESSGSETQADKQTSRSGDGRKKLVWLSQGVGENSWEGITKPILEAYKKATGVEVVGEFYSFKDLFDIIQVKIASGSSDYDVISVDAPMVAAYASRKWILPMDKYFTREEKEQFIDSALKAGSWKGKFYAPAENTSTQVLWYNTSMLDQAVVTMKKSTPENRLTWEEVVDMAKKVKEKLDPDGTNGIYGLDFQQVSRVYQMNALPNSLGGKNIGDDGFTADGVINDDAWVKALTWYQDLVRQGIASKGIKADEMSNYFYSGKLAFMVGGTWTASAAKLNDMSTYDCIPMPTFKGYENSVATPTGSWHFGINAASKNVDTAADFIKYVSLGEGNDMWLDANNDVPSRKDKLEEIMNNDNAADYYKIGAYEAIHTAVTRAVTPGFNEYSTILDSTWEDVRNGADVKEALDKAVEQINTAMKEYR